MDGKATLNEILVELTGRVEKLTAAGATPGLGTLPTHTPLFVAMLVAVVLLVGALTFLPALALGPIAEQLARF